MHSWSKGVLPALVGSRPVNIEATTAGPLETPADTIATGVFEDEGVAHDVPNGALGALLDSGEASREFRRLAVTHAEGRRFILVGLGPRQQFDAERARVAAAAARGRARELSTSTICWEVPHHAGDDVVAGLVEGTLLHAYRFDRYKRSEDKRVIERLLVSAHHDVSEPVRVAGIVSAAQNRARDLANTPGNDLTPEALAAYAVEMAGRHERLTATVLEEDQLRESGMGAFAAVAQGSAQGARLIRLEYEGAAAGEPRLALIGKAVTFDTGGISLKPPAKMYEMKFDMAGGGAVIEAIAAIAELELPVRVLGVVGATENLPSGRAVKPGDIVTALDGTTIEVNNTDAEGRLVLADCITHALRQGCDQIVDIATLTGGIVTALGSVYAGLMSNDDRWARHVEAAADSTGELVWRMPLHPQYAAMVKGRYAQLTNLTERREASSIAAAEFLHHFAGQTPWAHIDIAGMGNNVRLPYFTDKAATRFGVRLMVEVARRLTKPLA
jgi:leucyl aminopeptidase